jgi:hypothetical protein
MLVNFIEMGINPNNIDIVGSVVKGVVPIDCSATGEGVKIV